MSSLYIKEIKAIDDICRIAEAKPAHLYQIAEKIPDIVTAMFDNQQISVKLKIKDMEFTTPSFKRGESHLKIALKKIGSLEVYRATDSAKKHFTAEEENVLKNLGGHIARTIQHWQMQEYSTHLISLLQTTRKINRIIAQQKNRTTLLKTVCTTLVTMQGWYKAWIGYIDSSSEHMIIYSAQKNPDVNLSSYKLEMNVIPPCWQEALQLQGIVTSYHPSDKCSQCCFKDKHHATDEIIGTISKRIEYGDTIFGILCVAINRDFINSKEELLQFEDLSSDIGFALYNSKLEETQKAVEKEQEKLYNELRLKNAELEQIVYATSHDLRSPLVNVQGFSKELDYSLAELNDIVKDERIPLQLQERFTEIIESDIQESQQFILSSISKMDTLLSGLLRLSRLGRSILNVQILDMNKLVKTVIADFEFRIKNTGISIRIGSLPSCAGDKEQLSQLFANLIDNSIKFLDPTRPGVIEISGTIDKKNPDFSFYRVSDNGIGIEKEHIQKVFQLFHRLHPQHIQGEGLGLTLVKRIVEKHNGTILLESNFGSGTTFFIHLPRHVHLIKDSSISTQESPDG